MECTTLLNKDLKRNFELLKEVKEYIEKNNLENHIDLESPDLMIDIYEDKSIIGELKSNSIAFINSDNKVIKVYWVILWITIKIIIIIVEYMRNEK